MKEYEIDKMASVINNSLGLKREEEIKNALNEFWKGKIAVTWDIADVQQSCDDMKIGIHIDDKDALEILDSILENHDASIGINWDVIENEVVTFLKENKRWPKY